MTPTTLFTRIVPTTAAFTLALCGANIASAVPIVGKYIEDSRCDPIPNQPLSDEIGDRSPSSIMPFLSVTMSAAMAQRRHSAIVIARIAPAAPARNVALMGSSLSRPPRLAA